MKPVIFNNTVLRDGHQSLAATRMKTSQMLPVVEKLSKEKGLSAVQYLNPTRDAWVDPSLIITDEVIKAYNAAHPATASPAPPPKK